ncbi:hypothetical protein CW354_03640 [Marinicaulis flavus]|uniref:Uncharacterized protein n=2 Tax=Hyphococcus luteus TaxID=2058213 RepID=A0A2S7K998_9PROT|nr:hypothetical protein CW354_03640 [Marinicaulis flavus]
MGEEGNTRRIEVKAKKGPKWANIKGVVGEGAYIVFVDLRKLDIERPDFYILSSEDWRKVALKIVEEKQKRSPNVNVHIGEDNCPTFPDQITKSGRPYRGCSVSVGDVGEYKDSWDKIIALSDITQKP